MKRTSLLVALLFILSAGASAQWNTIYTENSQNRYKHYSAATAANGDTVVNLVAAQRSDTAAHPFLVGIVMNAMVNSASYTVLDGGTTVAAATFPSTALTYPVYIPYNVKLQTSLVLKIVGANDVTLIYRLWR